MDAEELAEFLKEDLEISTPVDWLAWLTDAVTADVKETNHERRKDKPILQDLHV